MSNAITRVVVAVIGIPIIVGLVYWGGLPLALFVAVLAGLGAVELTGLARAQGVAPLGWLATLVSVAVPLSVWLLYGRGPARDGSGVLALGGVTPSAWHFLAQLTLLVLTATLAFRKPSERPLAAAAITALTPLYCGALPSFLLGVRYAVGPDLHWPAAWAVLFPLVVVWSCDTFAMYGGKLIGGPKLAPVLSPGKTRSGALAGLVGGIAVALLFNELVMRPSGFPIPAGFAALFGFVVSIVAQVGDLAESLFKREAGVKDSGRIIPGHGGVLDRLDSLYFAIPVSAMLYRAIGLV